MPLYIVGNGAHGRDIAQDLLCRTPLLEIVMLDENLKRSEPWPDEPHGAFVVGINDPAARRRVTERMYALGWSAYPRILADGTVEVGVVRSSFAWIANNVTIGSHTHINGGVFAVRCTIGDYCTIAPGVTICGDVTIGNEVFIGAGATISNLVSIGDGATVGAGATVLRDVKPGVTVVGTPAREVIR